MKVIHRYILSQVVIYALLSIAFFVFVLLAGKLIRDGAELISVARVSPLLLLKLIGLMFLYVFTYAVPLGFLTAILLVLGRMSSQNEIVALKASGVGLFRFAKPIFVLAIFGTVINLGINGFWAPNSKATYREDLTTAFMRNPLQYFQEGTFLNEFPGYLLYINKIDGHKLTDCWLWELDTQARATTFIKADTAHAIYDEANTTLSLTLRNGSIQKIDQPITQETMPALVSYDQLTIKLNPTDSMGRSSAPRKYNQYTLPELIAKKKELKALAQTPENLGEIYEVRTQIQKSFAFSLSLLALVSVAIPLGIKASRKETYANLVLALALSAIYFTMMVVVTWFDSKPQVRPDLLIWIPNILFLVLGVLFFNRANRN